MKQKNLLNLLLLTVFTISISFSQTVIDDFTDGNFTSNQIWTGSTTSFSVITDGALPSGSASTDGSYLASNSTVGDVSLAMASTEVSEWRFSIGSPNFNPSGSNYIGVILMASAAFSGDVINGATFQGYYLRIGDSGTDPIELWRKTGSGETIVGDFPNSPSFSTGALQNGLNIRVTRSSTGVFELFYSTGFQYNEVPTTSAGTVTNNTYTTSSYFGIFQNIGSTSSSRRVYIDNIQLGVVTWDGSDSNDWSTGANWDTNSAPTSNDNIIIPASLTNYPTVTTGETIHSLIIDSGATLVATNSSFTVTNSAIYSRNLTTGSQWYFMSSPIVGETFDATWATSNSIPTSSLDSDNIGIGYYDNTSLDTDDDGGGSDTATGYWRYLQTDNSNSSNFNAVGQGYSLIKSTSGNVSFVGSGIYTSNQTFTLVQGVNNNNLVGNPFSGFITLGTFYTTNSANIGTSLYFWDGSQYVTRTSGAHSGFEIAPGQGFFVEASSASNITFEVSDVSHQSSDTFGSKTANTRPEIKLNVAEGKQSRYANIYYIDGTTTGYDSGYDGKLFNGVTHSFVIYSHLVDDNGLKYQVQSLPNSNYENMVVPIGVIAASGKEITFTAETLNLPSGIKVYLEDREKNTTTRLDEANSEYKITLDNVLNGVGRFYLHTRSSALSTEDIALSGIGVYAINKNTLRVTGVNNADASIKVYNILGKKVLDISFASNGNSDVSLPNLTTGVYIVQLSTKKGKISKKIVLK